MTGVTRAFINSTVLEWARIQAGLGLRDAAKKAGVSLDRLRSWESGNDTPTLRQLRLLGRAYKRPSAFFYLNDPPQPPPDLPDFRKVPNHLKEMPPEFRNEIRKARFRREIALDISNALAEEVNDFSLAISYTDSIPVTASKIRDYFALSLEEQFSWRDPYAALKRIIQLFEYRGILVFQYAAIDVGISRGFSILETQFPVIALNGADTPRARIFTLFHEVTHLGLGSGAICDLRETDSKQDIEVFCNAVAAEALVPGEALLGQAEVKISRGNEEWPEPILVALSNRFSVSREVVLRRLLSLGLTTRDFYQAKREEYLEQYKEIKANRRGFMWFHKRVVRDNGPAFTNLVLDAYQQQRISAIEFSRFLGDINLKHYDSIVEEVRT